METKLEQIAAKARREPNSASRRWLITSRAIECGRILFEIPKWSAAGVDGQTVEAAKKSFDGWIEPMFQSIHRQGYRAPDIRRVYIPKPGKTEKRPLGVPTVADRALQRSTAECCPRSMNRTFCPADLAVGQSSALIMPWRPSMRLSPAAKSGGAGGGFEELLGNSIMIGSSGLWRIDSVIRV